MRHEALHDYDDAVAGEIVLRSPPPNAVSNPVRRTAPDLVSQPIYPQASLNRRYSDRPLDWRSRLFGLAGTGGVVLAILTGLVVTWQAVQPMVTPAEALIVTTQPLAAPPEPVEEVPEGPRQVERKASRAEREPQPEPPKLLIPQPSTHPVPIEPPAPAAKPADPVPETTAPKTMPAPPARRASSNADATWEALLLAHLEKYRRYPAAARARREEGVSFVTFRMNRAGKVLSASLGRSSGSIFLDRAAMETIRRAQPLPAIPEGKPDELELSVPVEFFLQ